MDEQTENGVSGRKKDTYVWEARSSVGCIYELRSVVKVLQLALTEKFDDAVSSEVKSLATIFDIENAFIRLSAYEISQNGKLQITTADRILWEHSEEKNLKHLKW